MVANLIQIEDEATLVCADVITNPLPIHPATHSTAGDDSAQVTIAHTRPAERELDRAALDRSVLSRAPEVKLSGGAKLSVDVNAPRGTTVQTSTNGDLFKKTEVSRQTQMEPAASGPEE
jgi:hypothetical protein